MKSLAKLILIFMLFALVSCSKTESKIVLDNGIWIANVSIVSPEADEIKPYVGNVVIDNEKIIYVGKNEVSITGNYQKVNGLGKYIIPGLIDSHVHLSSIAGMNYRQVRKLKTLADDYFEQLPKSYLYFGYTTLIDPNNYNPRIMDQLKSKVIRPDIYTCGEQVKVMNDFMMAEDPPEERYIYYPNFLHDKYNSNVIIPDSINPANHSVQKVVNGVVDAQDGICLKAIYEDGFGGTEEMTWELPSLDIIKDLVSEAKNQGIPVLLHANSYSAQEFGANANVDIIAHGMWHWGLLEEYLDVTQLPPSHKDLLTNIAAKNIGYQPTFRVIAGQRDVFDATFINNQELENVLPSNLLEWLQSDEGLWQKNRILTYGGTYFNAQTSDAQIASMMQLILDKITVSTNYLYSQKGNLVFGSDTPAMNNHANPPGYNGYLEMQEWVKAGVSLEDLLKSATINNAKEFNLDGILGSIEVGKKANLLLLENNPLEAIEAYNSISQVLIGGKIYARGEFSALQQ